MMKRYDAPKIDLLQMVSKENILGTSGEIDMTLSMFEDGLQVGNGESIGTSTW